MSNLLSPYNPPVPEFRGYIASVSVMNSQQRKYYYEWVSQWQLHNPLDVHGEVGYIYCYIYDLLWEPVPTIMEELTKLIAAYSNEEKLKNYCKIWLSDCFVILGNYNKAIAIHPAIPISSCNSKATDRILNLKLLCGERISGGNILTLSGPRVTKWGREHLDSVETQIEILIRTFEDQNNVNILDMWKMEARHGLYSVFEASFAQKDLAIPSYSFSRSNAILGYVVKVTREAENSARDLLKVPHVREFTRARKDSNAD